MKKIIFIAVFLGCLGVSFSSETPAAIFPATPDVDFVVYPNPFTDEIQINVESGTSINITNIIGKVVYENLSTDNELLKIDMSHLPNGIYLVRASIGNEILTRRIVKK